MKRPLLDLLICPACLPTEQPLVARVSRWDGDDITSGHLSCGACGTRYPVEDGVATLLPAPSDDQSLPRGRYETEALVSAYLWSHYGDLFGEPEAGKAYTGWAAMAGERYPVALDAGCSVGRFAFELSARSDLVVGLDRSTAFVRAARVLMREGRLTFPMLTEGRLSEPRTFSLAGWWRPERVEFIVADALTLPFRRGTFAFLASLNLLDKVSHPLGHLHEINRVAAQKGARFLFSDPFSWSEECAPVQDWLGGKEEGPYAGRGIDNVRRLLEGGNAVIHPPWRVVEQGSVSWQIRNHRNHHEWIRSEFLLSTR